MQAQPQTDSPIIKQGRSSSVSVQRAYEYADLSGYSFKDRMMIKAAGLAFYLVIRLLGRTIRFEVDGWQHHEQVIGRGHLPIFSFWHEFIFTNTYWWRNRGHVVLTSQSFDGEYIARFIQRLGYGAVRGSSTRGAVGAVVEMVRLMRAGCGTCLVADGPRGPRRVAKKGSVLLAKKTGHPVLPETMALQKYWTLPSWDSFQIPKPFTRAKLFLAAPIYVPADADDATLDSKLEELQSTLEDLDRRAEEWRASL